MPYTTPATRSPGRVVLTYTAAVGTDQHKAGFNLVAGHMPESQAAASTMATRAANDLAMMLIGPQQVIGWSVVDPDGAEQYSGQFSPAIDNSNGDDVPGAYHSVTLCLSGRGTAGAAGERRGQTRVFVYNSYPLPAGSKRMPLSTQTWFQAFADALDADADFWADFYGQKAVSRPYVTTQFNAHAQRVLGS